MMIVGRPSITSKIKLQSIKMGSGSIARVDTLKILGVTIDDQLSWTQQTNQVIRKGYGALAMLYPLKNILSTENKKVLANAYILSIINYASMVWLGNEN